MQATVTLFIAVRNSYNTLGIIKYLFGQKTAENPWATCACINYGEASCSAEIAELAICIGMDIEKK